MTETQKSHLNTLIIEGIVVRKTELRKLKSGTDFCQFTIKCIGIKDSFYDEFDCFAYSELAKKISQKKLGQLVRVMGRLRQDRWVEYPDKERSRCVVVAEHIYGKNEVKF